jgi:hypothetical protein
MHFSLLPNGFPDIISASLQKQKDVFKNYMGHFFFSCEDHFNTK